MSISFRPAIPVTWENGIPVLPEYADDAPEVNVASTNGAELLQLLGLFPQGAEPNDVLGITFYSGTEGETSAVDFTGRILIAIALLDTTCDTEGLPGYQQGRWHYFGRRPGYLAEKLAELSELADWTAKKELRVCWG